LQRTLPPAISTGDPGSYAQYAVSERQPRIIEQVIEGNRPGEAARTALLALAREIREGRVTSPLGNGSVPPASMTGQERRTWEDAIDVQEGRRWLDLPWYFAESFFYLKLLAAFGYYAGAARGRDPFSPQKERELMDPDGGLAVARRVAAQAEAMGEEEGLAFAIHSALWGNRLDLSTFEVDESRRRSVLNSDADSLLVDHTARAVAALTRASRAQVLLDNSGPELVCDLLLVDRLLTRSPSVTLHAKKAPFFVSDATVSDTLRTIDALAGDRDRRVSAVGERLHGALRSGHLRVLDHWFWNSPLHFTAFPEDVRTDLARSDILVVKGDANYRRTLEDRKWDTWLSLDDLASYFPAPFLVLRTMKSELVVDVPAEEARRLSRVDPSWMVNGKRGIIRHVSPRSSS